MPAAGDVHRIEVDALNDRSQMVVHHFIDDADRIERVREFLEARNNFPWWRPLDTFPTPQCSLVFVGTPPPSVVWIGVGWLGRTTGTARGNRLKGVPASDLADLEEMLGLQRGVCTCTHWPCEGRAHASIDGGAADMR